MSIAGLGLCDWCLYQNAEELLSYAQKQNVRSVQLEVKYPLLPATLFNLSRSIEQYKKSGFTVNALSMNFLNETGIYTATGYAPMLDACSRAMQFAGSHHIKEVIFPFFELNEANTADKVQTMLRFIRDCYKKHAGRKKPAL